MTLCFVDTETTSLRPDRRAWEIGLIVRRVAAPDHEERWFIDAQDLDLGNADLMSLKVGRYHERHPHGISNGTGRTEREKDVLERVEYLTRGAHLVGAVVSFDAEVLAARMRANGLCPSWHYHLIDVEALAVGYLAGKATSDLQRDLLMPPWKSDALSSALGVTVSEEDRHTALGDARVGASYLGRAAT